MMGIGFRWLMAWRVLPGHLHAVHLDVGNNQIGRRLLARRSTNCRPFSATIET